MPADAATRRPPRFDRGGSSRARRRARRFWTRHWSAVLVAVLALTAAVAAVRQTGLRTSDNHLDDALVYVSNTGQGLVGSVNTRIDDLSASTSVVGTGSYSLHQDGDTALLRLDSSNELETYDSSENQISHRLTLPAHNAWSYGAGTLAVWDTESGAVWFGPVDQMMQADLGQAQAQMHLGRGGSAVVTSSGQVVGLNTGTGMIDRVVAGKEVNTPLAGMSVQNADVQLSAVGEQLVVLNTTASTVWREGWDHYRDVPGASGAAHLLPPVAHLATSADVVLATRAGLIGVQRDGSVRNLGTRQDADPITPVQVGSCLYGVNASLLTTACRGAAPRTDQVPGVQDAAHLVLQANRDHVVLNEQTTGVVWLVQNGMRRLTDWKHVQPVVQTSATRPSDTTQADPTVHHENSVPVVHDWTFFARVGQDTVLPVLDACTDADGDILTVTSATIDGGASAAVTSGSNGVQVRLSPRLPATYMLTFTVSDGTHSVTGRATVKAEAGDLKKVDHAPVPRHPEVQKLVTSRQDVTWHLLNDWRDPDGDAMQLVDAHVENAASGNSLTWSPDGTVTFHDVGKQVGQQLVSVRVGDGVQSDVLHLRVKVTADPAPPLANGDYVRAVAGVETTISPLANDEGNPRLGSVVAESQSVRIVMHPSGDGSFSFTAPTKGTYYLKYEASNGATSYGIIRVDVDAAHQGGNRPLVAGRDVVLLPASPAKTLLDPLLNDTGDDDKLLVVLDVETNPALRTVVSDRHLISFSWVRMLSEPVTLTYHISDGQSVEQGTIEVVPVPEVESSAPVTVADTMKVRAGETGTMDVLANDTSPLGLDLTLASTLPQDPDGVAWVQDNKVRVSVPATTKATSYAIEYTAIDSQGKRNVGFLTVTVTSRDAANDAPRPLTVDARVASGSSVRIPIPLDGIDPNGDAVQLRGLASAPSLGWVSAVGNGWLEYHAMPAGYSTGTDTFGYEVVDSGGKAATGTVRVGVAQPSSNNTAPVAVSDDVTVAPGRPVRLDLLANDYDVDGDPIHLIRDSVSLPGYTPTVSDTDSSVQFVAPSTPTPVTRPLVGTYRVADSQNAESTGSFSVTVSENAPRAAPVAHDDVASLADIEAAGKDGWVRVNVRRNDTDADGSPDQLRVQLPPDEGNSAQAGVDADGYVRVRVASGPQQVRYTVTDADGLSAQAVLTVPGTDDDAPHLRKDPMAPLVVASGSDLTINLNQWVVGSGGRSVHATTAGNVGAVGGTMGHSNDPTTLTFHGGDNYVGPGAVAVQVSDDQGSGRSASAWVTLPITVVQPPRAGGGGGSQKQQLPKVGVPPQGADQIVQVGAGEDTRTIDLTTMYTDPQGQQFYFGPWQPSGPVPAEFTADSTSNRYNSVWKVRAGDKARPGASVTYTSTVTDAGQHSRKVSITFVIAASTRPVPTAMPDSTNAEAGHPVTVAVTANDRSNLRDDPSVHLVGAPTVTSGAGTATQDAGKGTVTVTPAASFAGQMVVQYTIGDATENENRQVNGTLTVTVTGPPGAPGVPVQQAVGDGTFTVQFTPAAAHGATVSGYSYVATPASGSGHEKVSGTCAVNACTVTNVANGVSYTVVVVAHNQVGDGPPSGASAPIMPDVKPEAPQITSIDFGDGQVTVHWTPALSKGSPVSGYQVQVADSQEVRPAGAGATSLTWTGLTNGKAYTFTVRAQNHAGWSDPSNPMVQHPTGPPGAPSDVTAADDGKSQDGNWIDVQWMPPADDGGDPVLCYTVTASDGTVVAPCQTQLASGTGRQGVRWQNAKNGVDYTFTVTAQNRGKTPGAPGKSEPAHSFGAPDAPTDATLVAGDGCVTISGIKTVTHGEAVDHYVAQTDPASSTASSLKDGGQLCGLTNGRSYTVQLQAVSGKGDGKASQMASVGTVVPFGKLPRPSVSVGAATNNLGRQITITPYTAATSNGNDVSTVSYEYKLDDGSWTPADVHDNSFTVVPSGANGQSQLWVRGTPATKGSGPGDEAQLSVPVPMGANADTDSGKVHVHLDGWPGDHATCKLSSNGQDIDQLTVPLTDSANKDAVFAKPMVDTTTTPKPGQTTADVSCSDGDLQNKVTITWNP